MSDNARFHNKLHRRNHHTKATDGFPDSATDPIASYTEPFQGDFVVNGNLSASGSIFSVYYTLSNINIASPILSANVGFKPTNSLIVVLSGISYAIPLTYVGSSTFNNGASGVSSLSSYVTYLGPVSVVGAISGRDANNWNSVYSVVTANSAFWSNAYSQLTGGITTNWNTAYTQGTAYANTSSTFIPYVSANTLYAPLSSKAYTINLSGNIVPVSGNNVSLSGYYAVVAGGSFNSIVSSSYSNINGGFVNSLTGNYTSIVGGSGNCVNGNYSVVAGGVGNYASCRYSNIGGGYYNVALGNYSSINGGFCNNVTGDYSNIVGGCTNAVSNDYSYVVGGSGNVVQSRKSGIINGFDNTLSATNSLIAGCNNTAVNLNNVFVFGSNITATTSDYTYVNNISAQSFIRSSSAYLDFIDVSPGNIGTTLPNTRGQFFSNVNSYSQVNHQNINSGTGATTDFIATNDAGSDVSGYIDVGINSSTYNMSAFSVTGPNDAYLYTAGAGNLVVGTSGIGNIVFFTSNTLSANEVVRITNSGNVGIGISRPGSKLTVTGDISASGALYGNNAVYIRSVNQSIAPVRGNNTASGVYSSIGGGCGNSVVGNYSGISSGNSNVATVSGVFIGGGVLNTGSGVYSTITGGCLNNASCAYSNIVGGVSNCTQQIYAFIGGGNTNTASNSGSVVTGGSYNSASGVYNVIGGGTNNNNCGDYSIIVGGKNNTIYPSASSSVILGSDISANLPNTTYVCNLVSCGDVCGSMLYGDGSNLSNIVQVCQLPYYVYHHIPSAIYPVSGSNLMANNGCYSTIAGGANNSLSGSFSFIAAGSGNNTNSFNNTFILGSNLQASRANYTYVNNISSKGTVAGSVVAAQTFYISNSIEATVSGPVTKKFPVYDQNGNLLGYIPIYAS